MRKNNYLKAVQTKEQNELTNVVVYYVIPNAHNYENTAGLCRSIAAFSVASFYASNNESEYLKLISGVFRDLIAEGTNSKTMIQPYQDWVRLSGVNASYEFVSGKKASLSMLKYASGLQPKEKAAVLAVIGGHTVSVLMEADSSRGVSVYYSDPYFGQVYKQYVARELIENVLQDKAEINNVFSVFDSNNILFARSAIRDDATLDSNHSVMFLSYLKNSYGNAQNKMKFSVKKDKAIKYLAQYPGALLNIEDAMTKKGFEWFIRGHASELINELEACYKCFITITNSSPDSVDIIYPPYARINSVARKIKQIFNYEEGNRNTLKHFNIDRDIKYIKPAHLCVKLANTNDIQSAEFGYLKLISQDKETIASFFDKCLESGGLGGLEEIEKINEYFGKQSKVIFTEHNQAYYAMIDSTRSTEEDSCLVGKTASVHDEI